MPQETFAVQSQAGSPDVAAQDASPSGAVAAGQDEPGRAQAGAQVADGYSTGGEDLQPSSSRTTPDPSEAGGRNSEADSQSVQGGDNAGALGSAESVADTSRRDVAPTAPAFNARQVGAARRFGLLEEDLVVLEALGRTGRGFLERLAKADSDLSRRYSRLGRAEQGTAGVSPAAGSSHRDQDRAAHPGAPGQAEAPISAAPLPGTVVAAPGGQASTRQTTAPEAAAPTPATAQSPDSSPNLAEELARLRGQVLRLLRETQEGQAARESADAERFFRQLDGETYPHLGSGPTEKLAEDSPHRASREALLVKAREIRSGHEAVHGEPMEVEESLREALTVLSPDASAQAERKRLRRQLRLREAGLIARPTRRGGGAALESPADRTARALEEWQGRRGVRFFED